jgi:hypothetical protein
MARVGRDADPRGLSGRGGSHAVTSCGPAGRSRTSASPVASVTGPRTAAMKAISGPGNRSLGRMHPDATGQRCIATPYTGRAPCSCMTTASPSGRLARLGCDGPAASRVFRRATAFNAAAPRIAVCAFLPQVADSRIAPLAARCGNRRERGPKPLLHRTDSGKLRLDPPGTTLAARFAVAALSFLLSFLARKAGDIVQAVFGWSVMALFGRLERRAQILVIGALLLSLAWPALVIGAVLPSFASWAIALVPLHKWIGETALRVIWIVLAVAAPIGVGLLVRAAAPSRRTGVIGGLLHGYPMALGFFLGLVVIAVTVPIIKLASIVRGWSDEHVYLQAHDGEYDAVLRSLAEACARAGQMPRVSDAPVYMVIATSIMRTFARGAVTPLVPAQLRRLTAEGVEMYLYPADLLLRGDRTKVARIRAMLSRTSIDGHAYLVESNEAKHVQDELARLHAVLRDREDRGSPAGEILVTRLREIFDEMRNTDVSYAEWSVLEAMARRLERRLIMANLVPYGTFPIDDVPDALPELARQAQASATPEESTMDTHPPQGDPLDQLSAAELVSRTLADAKQLARSELELAKQDLRTEAKAAIRGAGALIAAFACALLMLACLAMSLVLAAGSAKLALGLAVGFLVLAAIAAILGYKALPKQPLAFTRRRVASDVDRLKEHMA